MGVPNAINSSTGPAARTSFAWLRIHMIDVVALPLGTALTLRFWYTFFGVHNQLFMTIVTVASFCEMASRIINARRQWARPVVFCAERRFDLVAAILLGTAPWPIALPLNEASPLGSAWQSVALPGWLGLVAALMALGFAIRHLVESFPSPQPDGRRRPIRDLSVVPDLHVASMFVLSAGPRTSKA